MKVVDRLRKALGPQDMSVPMGISPERWRQMLDSPEVRRCGDGGDGTGVGGITITSATGRYVYPICTCDSTDDDVQYRVDQVAAYHRDQWPG